MKALYSLLPGMLVFLLVHPAAASVSEQIGSGPSFFLLLTIGLVGLVLSRRKLRH